MAGRNNKSATLRELYQAEYNAWKNAIHRCHRPNNIAYRNYGARGIKVSDIWRTADGFALFIDHIGPKPDPSYTLDRIDNDKGYEPGNVRWADRTTQQNNRRKPKAVVHDFGWGVALSQWRNKRGVRSPSALIPYQGRTQTLVDWCRELNLKTPTVRQRLQRGLSPEQALSTSPRHQTKEARFAAFEATEKCRLEATINVALAKLEVATKELSARN